MTHIETDSVSARLRGKAIRRDTRQLLITNFKGTSQEADITAPVNCDGFGRIRHFRRGGHGGWPINPLPIEPACRHLGLRTSAELKAEVFQNAACNWRCWYCYVPFDLLAADEKKAGWLTAEELVDKFIAAKSPALMIDLSGGQPELTPEWVPWIMDALTARKLDKSIFLWSDDNLSNDYFWQYLTEDEIARVASYQHYARVCCFKGFDDESFAFNTKAHPELFSRQFDLFARYLGLGLELYAYVTITGPSTADLPGKIARFIDRLQQIHPKLPLRTVPLEIVRFSVLDARNFPHRDAALATQQAAINCWQAEMEKRFSSAERALAIVDVPMGGKR
jgi:uncharacterized Fe-S cluster-containing radical SAM superfamily protein